MKKLLDPNSHSEYLKWKRKNVSYRGLVDPNSKVNNSSASLGIGLYTAALSNKKLSTSFGKVYFIVNGRPKNPLKFRSRWYYEIWEQNYINKWNIKNNIDDKYSNKEFFKKTSINNEILSMGYDGVEIKGVEYVNYTPSNVLYFDTEYELIDYYINNIF